MAAAVGDRRGIEIGVGNEGPQRVLPAGTAAVDTDARKIDPGARCRRRANRGDPVGEASVAEVFVADVMKRLAAVGCPHPIGLHDDKPQLRQLRHRAERRPPRHRHVAVVRTGVDVFDHGVAAGRIKVGGAENDAVDVGDAVASLGHTSLRLRPASGHQA